MSGGIDEDLAELVALRVLHELRVRIGDGDEVLAGAIALDLLHAIVEVAVEHHRLGRRARLRRDHEQRSRDVDARLEVAHRLGHRRVENLERRIAFALPEHAPRHFRAEARAAHAEDDDVRELALHALGELADLADVLLHLLDDREPAERVGDDLLVRVVVLPERRVFLPDALDEFLLVGALHRGVDRRLRVAEVERDAVAEVADGGVAARLDRRHQRHERLFERLHAVFGELRRDLLEAETVLLELAQHFARLVDVLLQRHDHLCRDP